MEFGVGVNGYMEVGFALDEGEVVDGFLNIDIRRGHQSFQIRLHPRILHLTPLHTLLRIIT